MSTPSQTAVEQPADSLVRCYHCDHPIRGEIDTFAEIDGAQRPMCCTGCKSAAEAIAAGGLDDYYRQRSRLPTAPAEPVGALTRESRVYDNEDVQRSFVRRLEGGEREASLILGGIECAACASLNERNLQQTPGILDAQVNFSTHRATVRWDPQRIRERYKAWENAGVTGLTLNGGRNQDLELMAELAGTR